MDWYPWERTNLSMDSGDGSLVVQLPRPQSPGMLQSQNLERLDGVRKNVRVQRMLRQWWYLMDLQDGGGMTHKDHSVFFQVPTGLPTAPPHPPSHQCTSAPVPG